MPMPDHLKAFLAVAETGSVTRAAERLGLTQSGVSRKISWLEEEIGFRVFDRVRGRVALNRHGHAFAAHARKAVELLDNLPRVARSIGAGTYDRVRIVATSSIMHGLLPDVLAAYVAERPDLPPSATMRSLSEVLGLDQSDQVDVVLAPLPMRPLAFELVHEIPFDLELAVPEALLPAEVRPVAGEWPDLSRLAGLPFISLDPFASYQESVEALWSDLDRDPPYVAETTSLASAALLARAGVGCAILDPFVARALAGPQTVCARISPAITHAYGVHVPTGTPMSSEVERMLDHIKRIGAVGRPGR
ncbi:MAG: LysR family transcriptional regulator [Thalassobaculaceae bacterium]|nr:LysR family transcriptional regulator [Thalassobaculaceae bacterium]